ncbi:MAG TPA: methylmalonyl Co-A mutase-associated GTPase MeaB [Chloroflexia bacterium]|nr:methylmalonyl Co-A mutase-associated GTPase MeaB [Chloroflexia bacterium]
MTRTPTAEPGPAPAVADLATRVLAGDRLALTRAITRVENRRREAAALLQALTPHTGHAYLLGITGPPGGGKSTLTTALVTLLRARGDTVAIIAVDPTSALSGGALLGDRIRMLEFYDDPGVFIRSMASRGVLGGLSATTGDVARVLDAFGFDWVIIETVGVGQGEVAVAGLADTTLLIEVPGLGDDVQAIKAGVLEVADILVINKADKEGATKLATTLRGMLSLAHTPGWSPPIVQTVAATGQGVPELLAAIANHRGYLEHSGARTDRTRARLRAEVLDRAQELLTARLLGLMDGDAGFTAALAQLVARERDPASVAADLVARLAP